MKYLDNYKYSDDYIDGIRYGNPSLQDYHNMRIENYLDKILPQLQSITPPLNSSRATKEELNILIGYGQLQKEDRKEIFDSSLVPYINDLFIRNQPAEQEHIETTTQQIVDDVLPVITKLKYYFNRPRPSQLALYYNLKLFPTYSYFTSSPSYPSGHCTLSQVIGIVLGNHYPHTWGVMQTFMKDVAESRLHMGVHFPSDNNAAILTARAITSSPEFRVKYQL